MLIRSHQAWSVTGDLTRGPTFVRDLTKESPFGETLAPAALLVERLLIAKGHARSYAAM